MLLTCCIQIGDLSPRTSRAAAALVAALVGDAAARPLHWIYDQQELNTLLEGRDEVEFWPESKVDRKM